MDPAAASAPSPSVAARLDLLDEHVTSLASGLTEQLKRTVAGLEFLIDDDPRARRRLAELRASPQYEEAYTARAPLVSVLIPTWNRAETLTTRAIPSVLAQSYENVEVVVVGDHSPSDLCDAVAAIEDPRVRFHNLTIRGPYDDDPMRAWCSSGTPPLNAGLALARGQWIAVCGDDDELPSNHVEGLLAFARAEHLEFACGWFRFIYPDGSTRRVGSFPPKLGETGLQISLWHAGLRFLELELAWSALVKPNDWALIDRMMRIGVSMGQTDDVVVDYVPSSRGDGFFPPPPADETPGLRRWIGDLQERTHELDAEKAALAQRLAEADAMVLDLDQRLAAANTMVLELERRIEEVRRSRSWRLITLLRRPYAALRVRRQNARR